MFSTTIGAGGPCGCTEATAGCDCDAPVMPVNRARRLTFGLVAALSLAACGSTVQQSGAQLGQGGTSQNGSLSGTSVDPGAAALGASTGAIPGGQPGPGFAGSSGTTSADGAASAPTEGGSGPAAGGAPTAPMPGGKLSVGIPHLDQEQTNTFTAGFGSGLEGGDDKANFTILIDDLNKQGGILGRKVEPVFHKIDFSQSSAQYEQQACTDFTQDHHVSFVLVGVLPTLSRCLIGRGVGVVGDGSQLNTRDYESMPYYVQPGSFSLDRLAALQASEFTKMGLFAGPTPARVGVLYYDLPTYRFAAKVLVDGLKARGVQVVEEQAFKYAASTRDLGEQQAQVQSAALKFKTYGVTHVVGIELNAWLQGFFAAYASQQDYYPRYGWTSNQVPTNVMAVVPHKALENSLLLGFYPTYDTSDTKVYPEETRRCFRLLTSQGQPVNTGNQRSAAATACDAVRYLKAALTAGNGVTRDALVAGARALQRSFAPAVTYASFLPRGYGAGAAAIRPGAFQTECDCFAYTGAPYRVGG